MPNRMRHLLLVPVLFGVTIFSISRLAVLVCRYVGLPKFSVSKLAVSWQSSATESPWEVRSLTSSRLRKNLGPSEATPAGLHSLGFRSSHRRASEVENWRDALNRAPESTSASSSHQQLHYRQCQMILLSLVLTYRLTYCREVNLCADAVGEQAAKTC